MHESGIVAVYFYATSANGQSCSTSAAGVRNLVMGLEGKVWGLLGQGKGKAGARGGAGGGGFQEQRQMLDPIIFQPILFLFSNFPTPVTLLAKRDIGSW